MFNKLTIFMIAIYSLSNAAIASITISQKHPETINSQNYKSLGYTIEIQLPRKNEPELKRFYIKFPKLINADFDYAYSSALYSRGGKTLLSYRPEDIGQSDTIGEYYILANEKIISCLSLVNVYFKKGSYELHPPSTSVEIDLSSFLENSGKCNGKHSANDYY